MGLASLSTAAVHPGTKMNDDSSFRKMLSVSSLSKGYGDSGIQVFCDVEFDLRRGEFVSLVGPSGCGKTTLLKTVAGLMSPTSGQVIVNGAVIKGPADGMVMLFQDYAKSLLPWRTVVRNVELPLEGAAGIGSKERREKALHFLDLVGLNGFGAYHPFQLSGGMQQRTAIARALVGEPNILLMDEPFGSVDAQTRFELQDITLELMEKAQTTVLFVTHDIEEAIYMSSRILVLGGRPSRIADDIAVRLDAPRDQLKTRNEERFLEYRRQIYPQIRSTARKALVG
jgi:NitT/TauT family transport system ATP-binding protein